MAIRIDPQEINERLAGVLSARRAELGISLRDLDALSGVNHQRIRRALAAERPMLIDDFEAIARALGLLPWRVLQQVEDEIRGVTQLVTPDTPATEPGEGGNVVRVPGWGADVDVTSQPGHRYAAHDTGADPAIEAEALEEYP